MSVTHRRIPFGDAQGISSRRGRPAPVARRPRPLPPSHPGHEEEPRAARGRSGQVRRVDRARRPGIAGPAGSRACPFRGRPRLARRGGLGSTPPPPWQTHRPPPSPAQLCVRLDAGCRVPAVSRTGWRPRAAGRRRGRSRGRPSRTRRRPRVARTAARSAAPKSRPPVSIVGGPPGARQGLRPVRSPVGLGSPARRARPATRARLHDACAARRAAMMADAPSAPARAAVTSFTSPRKARSPQRREPRTFEQCLHRAQPEAVSRTVWPPLSD